MGNWDRSKLDLDGDDNWNETDEYDDTRTHNEVNELVSRDLDSTSGTTGDNYSLAYDAAGNLTDDGESYKYEYDAFYRLRKVKNQASTTLAEYRYNGLGHMIMVWEDTEADGDLDGSDVKFYPAYDEAWREVARYRETDSDPKEQFVNAMAGLDGYGRASYINDVVCRDRDNTSGWLAASDGTLEERYYYCPNWRGDVSALVSSGRNVAEWVKYSAYGVPFGLPGGDADSDGDNDSSDYTQIQAWIDAPAYDVRGDVDLDGDVDATDKALAQAEPVSGVTLARNDPSSSALGGRRSYAGGEMAAWRLLMFRRRALLPSIGLWGQRDSLGYHDGIDLYQYVASSPLRFRDPSGAFIYDLCAIWCATNPGFIGHTWCWCEGDNCVANVCICVPPSHPGHECAWAHERTHKRACIEGDPNCGPEQPAYDKELDCLKRKLDEGASPEDICPMVDGACKNGNGKHKLCSGEPCYQ